MREGENIGKDHPVGDGDEKESQKGSMQSEKNAYSLELAAPCTNSGKRP